MMKTLKQLVMSIVYPMVWIFVGMSYFNDGGKPGFIDGLERIAIRIVLVPLWIGLAGGLAAVIVPEATFITHPYLDIFIFGVAGILAIRVLVSVLVDLIIPVLGFFEGSMMPSNAVTIYMPPEKGKPVQPLTLDDIRQAVRDEFAKANRRDY